MNKNRILALSFCLSIPLFIVNNLTVLSGFLDPPDGHVATGVSQGQDSAQYITWVAAFQTQNLIPNYHLPWETEPGLFQPLLWMVGKLTVATGLRGEWFVLASQGVACWLALYCLLRCLNTFLETRKQIIAAWIVILCTFPLRSLAVAPWLLVHATGNQELQDLLASILRRDGYELPGFHEFVHRTTDGVFHGLTTSSLITFGTAATLAAFLFLANYLETWDRRFLYKAMGVVFVSALIHPFEFFVMVAAGGLAILAVRGRKFLSALHEASLLGLAGILGVAPYALFVLRHEWVRDVASLNRWSAGSLHSLLILFGLPTILALVFLVLKPRMERKSDLLLQIWFVCTFVGFYVPILPWAQHLMDGFFYCIAMLLVRQGARSPMVNRLWLRFPGIGTAAIVSYGVLCLVAYVTYCKQIYGHGNLSARPTRFISGVAPKERLELIDWFKRHARVEQLALVPEHDAPWLATVPMHSFASHHLFGITYDEQRALADRFFSGKLSTESVRRLILDFGIHHVAMPTDSPALPQLRRMAEAQERARVGSFVIFELPGNKMKRYPGLAEARRVTRGMLAQSKRHE